MGSSRRNRRRSRPIAVEWLEGRALLATVAPGTAPIQVQPMGVQAKPVKLTARESTAASAADALHVGTQYTKLVFSSATRKVGWSYVKAAFHGDSHKLENLARTKPVVNLGQSFKDVGHSAQAQSVGHSFHNFGHSISQQFHKVFK